MFVHTIRNDVNKRIVSFPKRNLVTCSIISGEVAWISLPGIVPCSNLPEVVSCSSLSEVVVCGVIKIPDKC